MIKGGNRKRPKGRKKLSHKVSAKFQIAKTEDIDYKNLALLQKFLNDRGKMIPRRITGVTAKQQRQLAAAIKRARFLALLTTGGVQR